MLSEFHWLIQGLPEDSMLRAAIKQTPEEVSSPEKVSSLRAAALS